MKGTLESGYSQYLGLNLLVEKRMIQIAALQIRRIMWKSNCGVFGIFSILCG